MRCRRGVIALLVGWWIVTLGATAQVHPLFYPSVQVEAEEGIMLSTPPEQIAEQIRTYLVQLMPVAPLPLYPKQPITLQLQLHVTSTIGSQILGNLEMIAYRPIYAQSSETPILYVAEEGLPFQITSELLAPHIALVQALPEDPLLGHIYYYTLLALASYYDSFAPYGGEEILQEILRLQPQLEALWQKGIPYNGNLIAHNRLAPQHLIPELRSTGRQVLRNIWYRYHRQALDSEEDSTYGIVLEQILQQLVTEWQKERTRYFFTFFAKCKEVEITTYLARTPQGRRERIKQQLSIIYPTLIQTSR